MIEWLILLLVVPAVIIPAVLLAGFAGCGFNVTIPPTPKIEDAFGTGIYAITLKVSYPTPLQGFEFERKRLSDLSVATFTIDTTSAPDTFQQLDATHYQVVDRDLQLKTLYLYRVRVIDGDGSFSDWSNPHEPDILAETLDFRTTFEWTSAEKAVSRNAESWEGYSYVQRIEARRLTASGDNIRLTLRASSASTASIERVYVSRVEVGAGSDLFDSASDLTGIPGTPAVIPMDGFIQLIAPYQLNDAQALLVAVDFGTAPTGIRATDPVPVTDSAGYQKPPPADQAPLQNRTGFVQSTGIRLIEKIEVG